MRLFVALDLDPALIERMERTLAILRPRAPQARWVPGAMLHLTLKFIGEAAPEREPAIIAALAQVRAAAFDFELVGLNVFPNLRRPHTLWAGVPAASRLVALAAAIEQALAAVDIPREQRAFAAHLTLARFRESTALRNLLPSLSADEPHWGRQAVAAFYLYQSQNRGGEPVYEKRASFPLRAE